MDITARVMRDLEAPWAAEAVQIDEPRLDEVLVRVESAGICATDVHAAGLVYAGLLSLPAVLGHEAAGVVEAVGPGVTKVAPGDKVALVFDSCGACRHCVRNVPSYCVEFNDRNFRTRRPDGSSALSIDGEAIGGHFLGQSSFATHSLVTQRSVVKLDADLDLGSIGPFGCGFLTGAGAVLNELQPRPGSSIVVFGCGAVGLAGVMAARLAGCGEIIAVDVSPERLEVARSLGATATVDATAGDTVEAIGKIVPGGVDFSLDSTGSRKVVHDAVEVLDYHGTCGVVGVGADQDMTLQWRSMLGGRRVMGITSGSAAPEAFLPELIAHYQAGRFPVDQLITYYPFEAFEQALADSRDGKVIKAVLTF